MRVTSFVQDWRSVLERPLSEHSFDSLDLQDPGVQIYKQLTCRLGVVQSIVLPTVKLQAKKTHSVFEPSYYGLFLSLSKRTSKLFKIKRSRFGMRSYFRGFGCISSFLIVQLNESFNRAFSET